MILRHKQQSKYSKITGQAQESQAPEHSCLTARHQISTSCFNKCYLYLIFKLIFVYFPLCLRKHRHNILPPCIDGFNF